MRTLTAHSTNLTTDPRLSDYLPVYYQACLDASPTASAVDLFGFVFTTGPFAMITGATIAATKRYRPQLWLAWALMLIGLGLTSTMSESTSRAASIGYQIPTGIAIGMTYSATYFPVLAPLPLESSAPALSFFVFVRTFAQVRRACSHFCLRTHHLL